MKLMVFDVGGTDIKYSVMDESLERNAAGSVPTPQDTQEHFFETLNALYREHAGEVSGIAMSLPGIIDSRLGRCNGGGWLRYNQGKSIAPELSALTGAPVHIANDGKCAAYAELTAGALKGCQNAAVFIIGTGAGGGLIIDGKIVNGKHFTAGEYSFMRLTNTDWDSGKSSSGVLCSTTGLLLRYREYAGLDPSTPLDGKQFFKYVASGEEEAVRALEDFAMQVAMQITNMTILLDLEKVAIGGGISRQPVLIETIDSAVRKLYSNPGIYFDTALPRPEIVPCHFLSEANQVGAYLNFVKAREEEQV